MMTECALCARACFFVFISSAVHTFDCEFSIRFDAESEYFHIRANSGKAYDLNAFEHTQTHTRLIVAIIEATAAAHVAPYDARRSLIAHAKSIWQFYQHTSCLLSVSLARSL